MTELKLLELRQCFEFWFCESFYIPNDREYFDYSDGRYKTDLVNKLWTAYMHGYNKDR